MNLETWLGAAAYTLPMVIVTWAAIGLPFVVVRWFRPVQQLPPWWSFLWLWLLWTFWHIITPS